MNTLYQESRGNYSYIRDVELYGNHSCKVIFDDFEIKIYVKTTDLRRYEACKSAYQKLYKNQFR